LYSSLVRFLGIDYGRRRIGLAISDPSGTIARPWKALTGHGDAAHAAETIAVEIARLASEDDGLGGVVLGLPTKLGGGPTDQTRQVEAFAAGLQARIAVRLSCRTNASAAARRKAGSPRGSRIGGSARAPGRGRGGRHTQDYLDRSSAASFISADDGHHTEDDQT
jgi:RNase H-fold protein (predicted Holliday junction resolvase)